MLTLEGGALAGLGLTFGHNECAGGGGEDEGLTKEENLYRLLTLLDEFLGLLQVLVNLSGNPGGLCLLVNALGAFVVGLVWWGHEGGSEGVVGPAKVWDGLHGEEEGRETWREGGRGQREFLAGEHP